jgi:hypothetical protein
MKNLWICRESRWHIAYTMTHRLDETRRDLVLRCSSYGCLEVVLCLGVVELDRSQSSGVEQPSNGLGLVDLPLERCLGDESVGLVVLVLREV